MSSDKRVDVLGIMDKSADRLAVNWPNTEIDIRAAREAVAELIEASQIALNYLIENGCSRERLAAALANIGPTP